MIMGTMQLAITKKAKIAVIQGGSRITKPFLGTVTISISNIAREYHNKRTI